MSSEQKKQDMIPLTGLWKSSTGKSLQGYFGNARIVIIPNAKKTEDKHPDYLAFIAPSEPKEKKGGSDEPSF